NGTIRENLLLGKPKATDGELLVAAEAANAREFIDRLPNGLGSVVGERGVKLSVGEKQRLSIARALLKDPPILILDEATASVDTATERLIQQALENLMFHRTCIVIAHRLSTIVRADQILVLDRGRIIERGTHSELLLLGGKYARLCEHSFLETTDDTKEFEWPATLAEPQDSRFSNFDFRFDNRRRSLRLLFQELLITCFPLAVTRFAVDERAPFFAQTLLKTADPFLEID